MVMFKENVLAHRAKIEYCHQTPTLYFWSEQSKRQNGDQTLLDIHKHEIKPSTSPANICTKLTRMYATKKNKLSSKDNKLVAKLTRISANMQANVMESAQTLVKEKQRREQN
jgi:hypothetical protein